MNIIYNDKTDLLYIRFDDKTQGAAIFIWNEEMGSELFLAIGGIEAKVGRRIELRAPGRVSGNK